MLGLWSRHHPQMDLTREYECRLIPSRVDCPSCSSKLEALKKDSSNGPRLGPLGALGKSGDPPRPFSSSERGQKIPCPRGPSESSWMGWRALYLEASWDVYQRSFSSW